MGACGWIYVTKEKDKWWAVMSMVMNFGIP